MLTSATIIIMLILAVLAFSLPRRSVVIPFIFAACFIPSDQRIIIMDLDFTVLRILVVVTVMRFFLRNEVYKIQWTSFDKIVLAWAVCGSVMYVFQLMSVKAAIYKSGVLFDVLGLYWIFRQILQSWQDLRYMGKVLAYCVIAMAPLVCLEWVTGKNPFRVLGTVVTDERDGRFRCQASFQISILLGVFWATLIPFFIGLARIEEGKILYWAAIGCSVFIIFASASSTPLGVLLVVLLLLCGFKWRRHVTTVGWCFLVMLGVLQLVMSKPIWHLLARVNMVSGSTGWYRYHLIDKAIEHFNEWALWGLPTTRHWGPGLTDITNQYLLEGIRGGVLTLILFLVMLWMGFKILIKHFLDTSSRQRQFLAWTLFVCLLGHCVSFLGVSYFGNIMLLWYIMLSIIGFMASTYPVTSKNSFAKVIHGQNHREHPFAKKLAFQSSKNGNP